jgi:protein ImuA
MSNTASLSINNNRVIADLRNRIERLEGAGSAFGQRTAGGKVSLGIDVIDKALGGGLRRTGLHEIAAGDESAAAAGFCAILLARLAGEHGTLVWCRRGADLYGPGLTAMGLDPARLIVVRPRREDDVLWVLEEGLRSRAPAAVLAETAGGGPIALRRLQLAAESSGVTALLLRPFGARFVPGPALSRWRIGSAMRGDVLGPRWRVELQRCRTGTPATWLVEWCHETGGFAVAPDLRDRPARPAAPATAVPAAL